MTRVQVTVTEEGGDNGSITITQCPVSGLLVLEFCPSEMNRNRVRISPATLQLAIRKVIEGDR